jgi:hypothetical protein
VLGRGVTVGLLEQVQGPQVEDEREDAERQHRGSADEEPKASLGQVFGQGHAGRGFSEFRYGSLVELVVGWLSRVVRAHDQWGLRRQQREGVGSAFGR